MFCPNCGHVNLATARFCAQCWQPLLRQFAVHETMCHNCVNEGDERYEQEAKDNFSAFGR
ncbi:MAG: zinc ribbon domain-containing protein [Armatimonadetes bacterium]|nr:zinc ribbon domain-containing protein [Armatimonadota bacterium]